MLQKAVSLGTVVTSLDQKKLCVCVQNGCLNLWLCCLWLLLFYLSTYLLAYLFIYLVFPDRFLLIFFYIIKIEKEKLSKRGEHQHPPLSASWSWAQSDTQRHTASTDMPFLPWRTMSLSQLEVKTNSLFKMFQQVCCPSKETNDSWKHFLHFSMATYCILLCVQDSTRLKDLRTASSWTQAAIGTWHLGDASTVLQWFGIEWAMTLASVAHTVSESNTAQWARPGPVCLYQFLL